MLEAKFEWQTPIKQPTVLEANHKTRSDKSCIRDIHRLISGHVSLEDIIVEVAADDDDTADASLCRMSAGKGDYEEIE